MRAFLSHSNHDEDKSYINLLQVALYGIGIDMYVAERPENAEADKNLFDKLKRHINLSDFFIVLYTEHAYKSSIVNHEIGFAADKQIIAIVEDGVSPDGRLKGPEHLNLNR